MIHKLSKVPIKTQIFKMPPPQKPKPKNKTPQTIKTVIQASRQQNTLLILEAYHMSTEHSRMLF